MTTGPGQNPYLFVVGCLRSGTTLLQRMLDSHLQLAVGYEGYEPGADVSARSDVYRNATRLRLAWLYALRPGRRHLAPKLLERTGESHEP